VASPRVGRRSTIVQRAGERREEKGNEHSRCKVHPDQSLTGPSIKMAGTLSVSRVAASYEGILVVASLRCLRATLLPSLVSTFLPSVLFLCQIAAPFV